MEKKRLDILLVEKGLCENQQQAQARILAGEVWVKEKRLEKAGEKLSIHTEIEVRSRMPLFASRAGHKIEHGLQAFHIDVQNRVCADIGASTGGFTDCLLKRGAKSVFAIDVGHGQLDQPLRNNPQVFNMEKTNARTLTFDLFLQKSPIAREISLTVVDVSFISLKKIMENLRNELSFCETWLLLFKPQFEVGPQNLEKGGIVKNESIAVAAREEFLAWMQEIGFTQIGNTETSPLPGKRSGNIEYLLCFHLPSPKI